VRRLRSCGSSGQCSRGLRLRLWLRLCNASAITWLQLPAGDSGLLSVSADSILEETHMVPLSVAEGGGGVFAVFWTDQVGGAGTTALVRARSLGKRFCQIVTGARSLAALLAVLRPLSSGVDRSTESIAPCYARSSLLPRESTLLPPHLRLQGHLGAASTRDASGASGWSAAHAASYWAATPSAATLGAVLRNPRGPITLRRLSNSSSISASTALAAAAAGRQQHAYLLLFYNCGERDYSERNPYSTGSLWAWRMLPLERSPSRSPRSSCSTSQGRATGTTIRRQITSSTTLLHRPRIVPAAPCL
jgi:hypothetical protein